MCAVRCVCVVFFLSFYNRSRDGRLPMMECAMLMYTCVGLKCNPHPHPHTHRIHSASMQKLWAISCLHRGSYYFPYCSFVVVSESKLFFSVLKIYCLQITFIHCARLQCKILAHGRRNISRIYLDDSNTNKWKESVMHINFSYIYYVYEMAKKGQRKRRNARDWQKYRLWIVSVLSVVSVSLSKKYVKVSVCMHIVLSRWESSRL